MIIIVYIYLSDGDIITYIIEWTFGFWTALVLGFGLGLGGLDFGLGLDNCEYFPNPSRKIALLQKMASSSCW